MAYQEDDDLENIDDKMPVDDTEDTAASEEVSSPAKLEDDTEQTGKEVEENTDSGQRDVEAAPMPQVKAATSSPQSDRLSKYQQFLQDYKALQDKRSSGNLIATLAQAGGQIGQAMAGKYSGQFKPDESGVNALRAMANQPVSDFENQQVVQKRGNELQDEMELRDPNSRTSQVYREYANKKLGLGVDDTTSAFDVQNLLKMAGKGQSSAHFQKVVGSYKDATGNLVRTAGSYDPNTHTYIDSQGQPLPPDFIPEGLNPFQSIVDPITGNRDTYNKSRGYTTASGPTNQVQDSQDPAQVWNSLDANSRKRIDKEYRPAFNKLTEKTVQRLGHVDPIIQRLQEATHNPAALAQAKAEIARFDVGDQRLAQQEFDMFLRRYGYKGWGDWASEKTLGTIPQGLADDMSGTVRKTAATLQNEVNQKAEEQAKLLVSRLPKEQQVDPKLIAPLIYGNYTPATHSTGQGTDQSDMVSVTSTKTGKQFMLPKSKIKEALQKKLIAPIKGDF